MAQVIGSFPDGTEVTLNYPVTLDVHGLNWRPTGSMAINDGADGCGTIFLSSYGTDAPFHLPGEPLEIFNSTSGGQVELWESYPRDPAKHYLVFQFGDWYVGIADSTARCVTQPGLAQVWADNVGGTVNEGGFLELEIGPPVRFRDIRLTITDTNLFMDARLWDDCRVGSAGTDTPDGTRVHRSTDFASWCTPGAGVLFHADSSDEQRLDALVQGLRGEVGVSGSGEEAAGEPVSNQPPGASEGYRFSSVSVGYLKLPDGSTDTDTAEVSFELNWAQDSFPGVRSCFVEVYDSSNAVIGQYTSRLTALSEGKRMQLTVPIHGEPATAAAKCSGPRQDNVSGHYRITQEAVSPADGPRIRLSFFAEWQGGGKPGTQKCTATLYDIEGGILFRTDFNLTMHGPPQESGVLLPIEDPGHGDPASSSVVCNPYNG